MPNSTNNDEGLVLYRKGVDNNQFNSTTFRIPSLVRTKAGTLLGFADIRYNTADDNSFIEIACARSTNNGETWTYKVAMPNDGINENYSRVMDSTAIVLANGKVMLIAGAWNTNQWWNSGTATPKADWDVKYVTSVDDGENWSQPQSLRAICTGIPSDTVGFLGGVSNGIVMSSSHPTYPNRAILPVQICRRIGGVNKVYSGCIYSDNNGESWTMSTTFTDENNSENAIIQIDNNLIMSSRRDGNVGARGAYISEDGGATWRVYQPLQGKFTHGTANGSGCEGSWIKYIAKNGHQIGLLSHPKNRGNSYRRDNITVYMYDFDSENPEIKELYVVYPEEGQGTAGYSSMNYGSDSTGKQTLSILFETQEGINFKDITFLINEIEKSFKKEEFIMERPNPITRNDFYLEYLAFGGDVNKLPYPVSRSDVYLYKMCLNKKGIVDTDTPVQPKTGYYKALVDSNSTPFNTVGGFYDLGDKRTTEAKVKFRFTLRNTGNSKPSSIRITLMADNAEENRFVSNEYNSQGHILVTSPEFDREYVLESTYNATYNGKNLNDYKNIRPYLVLSKGTSTDIHGIDIHEIVLTIDGQDYDITNSTRVFDPRTDGPSKVEAINN